MRDYMDRRVTPPKQVTSPTWGTPPPCKQALTTRQLTWLCLFRWQLFKHRSWIHSVSVQQLGRDWQGSIVFQVVKDVASIPTVEILNLLSLTTNCVRVSGYLSSFVARVYEGLCHAFLQSYAKSSGTTIFKTRCPWRHSTQYLVLITVENTRGVDIRSLVFICESSLELNDCTLALKCIRLANQSIGFALYFSLSNNHGLYPRNGPELRLNWSLKQSSGQFDWTRSLGRKLKYQTLLINSLVVICSFHNGSLISKTNTCSTFVLFPEKQ